MIQCSMLHHFPPVHNHEDDEGLNPESKLVNTAQGEGELHTVGDQ